MTRIWVWTCLLGAAALLRAKADDIPVGGFQIFHGKVSGMDWSCQCVADKVPYPMACEKDLDCSTITCPGSTYLQCNGGDDPLPPPDATSDFTMLHGTSSGDWSCGCLSEWGTFQSCPTDVDCSSILCGKPEFVGCHQIYYWTKDPYADGGTITEGTGLYRGKTGGYWMCSCTDNKDESSGCPMDEVDCAAVGCSDTEWASCPQIMFKGSHGGVDSRGSSPPPQPARKSLPPPKSANKPAPKPATKPGPTPIQKASPKPAAAKPAPKPVAKESPKPAKQQSPMPATAKPAPTPVQKASPKPATAKPAPVKVTPTPGRKGLPNPAPKAASPKPVAAKASPKPSAVPTVKPKLQ